tara:strand:+ start:1128 stop:2111 length:984 start_codon:yes stop_codon:yes gene_type:complete
MTHQLIERKQNFTLDRKVLSVDTNDRDINKWPNPCEFEVSCPQSYNNIESIRLLNIQTPNKFYNISEYLQNNKFIVKLNSSEKIIVLDDGYYTISKLVTSLNNDLSDNTINITVKYNEVNNKIYFGHTSGVFSLIFNRQDLSYNNCYNSNYNNIYKQHSKWGLGAILGFNKDTITSKQESTKNKFQHESTNWIVNGSYIIEPFKAVDLDEYQNIYIEIDKLNKSDEIKPYIVDKINNTNSGIMNSFFAKVPILKNEQNQSINTKDFCIESASYFQPPLENINKLKIKIRYHNGLLVDLQNYNISMTFEINQIRNEIKDYNVRTPYLM